MSFDYDSPPPVKVVAKSSPSLPSDHQIIDGLIEVGGKKFRIVQISQGGKEIDLKSLKNKDKEFIQNLKDISETIINNVEENEVEETYKISLSEHKTSLNGKSISLETENKELAKRIESQASKILEYQETNLLANHKITFIEDVPSRLKATAIKATILTALIFASPLLLLTAAIIHGTLIVGSGINLAKHAYYKTDDLAKASDKMKTTEEKNKFDALNKVNFPFNDLKKIRPFDKQAFETQLSTKVERHILKAYAREGKKVDENQLNKLLRSLSLEDSKSLFSLKSKIDLHFPELDAVFTTADMQKIIDESKIVPHDETSYQQDTAYYESVTKLHTLLSNKNIVDYGEANQQITAALREIINSPTYQFFKEDSKDPSIILVSHLSSAIWNKVYTFAAYEDFGDAVLKKVDTDTINEDPSKTPGEKRRQILEEAHKKTSQEIYTDHGIPAKILYGFTHARQTLGSLASEGGVPREMAGAFGLSRYDSHGELRNNPSLQGVTKSDLYIDGQKKVQVTINNCYGGSPTIGDSDKTFISPEFEAVCQAVENKFFSDIADPNIPDKIYYTNLQNIENPHGEGERSFAIMELNRRFPHAFYGMTLSKDSAFYKMGGKYKNATWDGAENFGEEYLKIFENEKCYHFGSRTAIKDEKGNYNGGNGIYLPGGSKKWVGEDGKGGLIRSIIHSANQEFKEIESKIEKEGKPVDPAKLRGAYQEYVYSMIQAYTEMELAQETYQQTDEKKPLIMAIRACKENIDRGGAENAKYLHTRLPTDRYEGFQNGVIAGALESRALSSRGRVILKARLPQVLSFIEYVEPEKFQTALVNLLEDEGFDLQREKPKFTLAR